MYYTEQALSQGVKIMGQWIDFQKTVTPFPVQDYL